MNRRAVLPLTRSLYWGCLMLAKVRYCCAISITPIGRKGLRQYALIALLLKDKTLNSPTSIPLVKTAIELLLADISRAVMQPF